MVIEDFFSNPEYAPNEETTRVLLMLSKESESILENFNASSDLEQS